MNSGFILDSLGIGLGDFSSPQTRIQLGSQPNCDCKWIWAGFAQGPGRFLGGAGKGFGRTWAGSGNLLNALGGSERSFLLFLLLLVAFC